jgi:hypothetical protein
MQDIRLMDRIDSKFVAPVSRLPLLLSKMEPYFMVQLHNEQTVASYSTQYLDTEELDMYLMHQNGKLNRQKVRIRSYVESELSFLEIKNKNNKGRTKKIRVPVSYSHISSVQDLDTKETFWENSLFHRQNLSPSLSNTFKRITLVNNRKTERVTIDFDLEFHNHRLGNCEAVEQLMILELKQDGWQHSDFRDILQDMRIKQSSFSKYCIGTVLTNPHVKYNRFKKKQILITKLLENDSIGNGC